MRAYIRKCVRFFFVAASAIERVFRDTRGRSTGKETTGGERTSVEEERQSFILMPTSHDNVVYKYNAMLFDT